MKSPSRKIVALIALLAAVAAGADNDYKQFSLKSVGGETHNSRSLRGKAVFLTFFARECRPCREEVPFLNKLKAEYPAALAIIGIAFMEDDPAKVAALAKEWGIKYPLCIDRNGDAARAFRVNALPRGFLLDHKGKLLTSYEGMSDRNRRDLMKRLAGLQPAIRKYQSKGPAFYISGFDEINPSAAGQAQIWRRKIYSWLKNESIKTASNRKDADYIISGNVSTIASIVGVEIIITHISGQEEGRLSDRVLNGDDGRIHALFLEKLRHIPYVKSSP